ncbi:sugar transferase [Rhizobium laguerreae]|uniref:Sugar transferase n=1 Tax=Rhizobium laguerreae TaxID=1076926 RepID=A0AB35F730_9HYPH|nr:sugar transferase [Rhizobium laguerreae]MBY3077482.1 sugar transferase [Rhizobium laguerreae]MBY3110968.1 sugar transferase [Rhizobium laguerreae]
MDIFIAVGSLALLMPLLISVAIFIRIESRGPIVVKHTRLGKGGKTFPVFKFRTMYSDKSYDALAGLAFRSDPRITRTGSFLRITSIDELPQLFNVLRGDMSLVGPRAYPPNLMAAGMMIDELVTDYHSRLQMRPGISGLAQIRGLRGPSEYPAAYSNRIEADLEYIKSYSLALDLKILWQTVFSQLSPLSAPLIVLLAMMISGGISFLLYLAIP